METPAPAAEAVRPLDLPKYLPAWASYGVTVALVAVCLGLRLSLDPILQQRPMVLLLVLPVAVGAYLGGIGPGLLATGLVGVGMDYLLFGPRGFKVLHGGDLLVWLGMVGSGVVVAFLTGALHRSRAQLAAAGARLLDLQEADRRAHAALADREASLRRLAQLHEALLESTSLGCLVTDAQGRILGVNQACVQRSGHAREQLLAMNLLDLCAPEEVAAVDARLAAIPERGQDRFETRHRDRQGRAWPVELTLSHVPADGGRVLAIVQDVSARQEALEAVRALEQFNRAILDSVDAHLAVLDGVGTILAVNEPWRRFAAANGGSETLAAGIGDNYLDACRRGIDSHSPGAREAYDGITAVMAGRLPRFTLEYPCDGPLQPRWFAMSVTPLGDGGGVVIAHLDVTQRQQAARALMVSERRFQDIAQVSSDWFWELDRELRLTYVSESALAVLGYAPEELVGRKVLDLFPEDQREGMARRYRGLLAEGQTYRNLPSVLLHKDGSRRDALSTGTPMLGPDGSLVGLRGLDRDVTDLAEAERAHRRLEAELLQAQKLESIGRLAGGVAHDFNNMLGVILGQAEVAAMMPGSKAFMPFLGEITKAAQRSAELTRQLLAFARRQTVTPKVLDLQDTIQGMLKMLRRLIGEDVTLAFQHEEGLWKVRVDPAQVDQILANLAVNARDAIEGVGRLSIGLANVTVDPVFVARNPGAVAGEFVELAVADTGCGMGEDTLRQVFEPFFTTKAPGQGTGLGLATVFGIVKQNDGFILVDSTPRVGTRFRIFLPRHLEPEPVTETAAAPAAMPRGNGQTVLLVEDDPGVLGATRQLLGQLGYAVIPAGGPLEALRKALDHRGPVDLLLTDVVMPDMNGRELAEKLRALRPQLPVLFMSGYTADILAPHGVLPEDVHFLQKPASLQDLARKVDAVLHPAPLL